MKNKHALNFLLPVIAVIITLCAIETGVRLFWDTLSSNVIPLSLSIHKKSPDPILKYELIPGSSVYQDNVRYRINAAGIRDYAYLDAEKSADFRIAAVGDSFTYGLGVKLEDTWPKQLESLFKKNSSAHSFEVLNCGVMGYDLNQQVQLITTKVLAMDPDLIIIGYVLNDIGVFSREADAVSQFSGYNTFMKPDMPLLSPVLSRLKLWQLVRQRLYLKHINTDVMKNQAVSSDVTLLNRKGGFVGYYQDRYKKPEVLEALQGHFAALRSLSKRHEVPIAVFIFPEFLNSWESYKSDLMEVHNTLVTLLRKHGLPCTDLYREMGKYDVEDLRLSKYNHHPNRRGYAVTAAHLYDFLQQNQHVPVQ